MLLALSFVGSVPVAAKIAFAPPVRYQVSAIGGVEVVTDLNGDGRPDVVLGLSDSVPVMMNRGDGTLTNATKYPLRGVGSIVAADLDGDGHPDLAVTSGCKKKFYNPIAIAP